MAKELNSQVEVRVRLLTKASFVNALCMRQSNFLCLFTFFKLKSSYCQRRLQSEGPLVRSYRTVRLKTRSKILRLMSFNWKRSCQHRLSPTSPLWNHPPPSSSFSAFLEPAVLTGLITPWSGWVLKEKVRWQAGSERMGVSQYYIGYFQVPSLGYYRV